MPGFAPGSCQKTIIGDDCSLSGSGGINPGVGIGINPAKPFKFSGGVGIIPEKPNSGKPRS